MRNQVTDPQRKLIMESKQLGHSVVLTHRTDFFGMECQNPVCGRTKIEMGVCLFCKQSRYIGGYKDV